MATQSARFPLPRLLVLLVCALLGLTAFGEVQDGWTQMFRNDAGVWSSRTDLMVHWSAGHLAQAGAAERAYEPQVMKSIYTEKFDLPPSAKVWGYVYPPPGFLLARLIALTDYPTSALWFLGGSLLLAAAAGFLWSGVTGLLLVFGFAGSWLCLDAGQLGLLVAALLGLSLRLLDRAPLAAGLALGLVCVKPQFAVLMPLLFIAGCHKRAFAGAAASVLALAALSLTLDGTAVWQAFLTTGLPEAAKHPANPLFWSRFLSVYGLVASLGGDNRIAMTVQIVSAALASVLAVQVWQRHARLELRAAAALLAALLISPMFYDYDLPVALMAVIPVLRLPYAIWRWTFAVSVALLFVLPYFSMLLLPLLLWLLLLQVWLMTEVQKADT